MNKEGYVSCWFVLFVVKLLILLFIASDNWWRLLSACRAVLLVLSSDKNVIDYQKCVESPL